MSTSAQLAGSETMPAQRRFMKDFFASLVVFLVALPLSLGIALASGAPIMSGVIAAAVGGIVVGLLGGAPLQVSGPAAGLTVMVFGFVQQFGFAVTCAITVAAGLLQMAFGFLKIARVTLAISPAVIHGMLAGIGILIALAQLHVVLGGAPESSAIKNIMEFPAQLMNLHGMAAFLGLLTIGLLIVWTMIPVRALKALPAPLMAVLIATVVSLVVDADVARVELGGSLLEAIALPGLPSDAFGAFIVAVLAMTIVASAESLLCAVATDKLHTGPRANLDKELIGQGAGNTLSGLLGGLPITGVIVRSSANITAGGQTRWSGILHGVWILVFVTQLGFLISKVPLTVLAGLLVYVGVKLVNAKHIRDLAKHGELWVYLATVFGVVGVNLLAGIVIGILVAAVRLLYRLGHVDVKVEEREGVYHVRVQGALTFVGVPKLTNALATIPAGAKAEIDLAVDFLDHAGYEAIEGWRSTHEKLDGKVVMEAPRDFWTLGSRELMGTKDRPAA